jgi:hypothetical protein
MLVQRGPIDEAVGPCHPFVTDTQLEVGQERR